MEADWLDLTTRLLPQAAGPGWVVQDDHCFQRICLDHACGTIWYDVIRGRPAYCHAPDDILERATGFAREILAGRADLAAMNRQSLKWRGKARRTIA